MNLKRSTNGYSTRGTRSQQMLVVMIFIVMSVLFFTAYFYVGGGCTAAEVLHGHC